MSERERPTTEKWSTSDISCIIPAKNEAATIGAVVKAALALGVAEVIVVDDGSTDQTAALADEAGATVVSHAYSKGNGAAIKSGARHAKSNLLAMLDGDGQHDPQALSALLDRVNEGYDLVVGARRRSGQASGMRHLGNAVYNRLASWIVGQPVLDLTSGFRLVKRQMFLEVLALLPNGFSYPTTSTMAFYRSGYSVAFNEIDVARRRDESGSHINIWKDGGRFLLIIFRIAVLYSPLKVFFPAAMSFFAGGVSYYFYTFLTDGRFTNFGALLLTTSVVIFLIGLVSEQITTLTYLSSKRSDGDCG
ncbi:glycosyltransferase family 2 protein [Abyssibacter profundi]|uniref:Glycosyl transferase n=1 Tax=Abyssibacter profundi TaxID=2182787 RepID=A0A363UIX5_9GAMM|nr:glycosyltransferase family 2 protein [Abyssibacter profundi]PWN55368.1 glycosyl transferase [Abyssibacter profundi]